MPDTLPTPILLIGCGKMGQALLAGWLAAGIAPNGVTVVDPRPADDIPFPGIRAVPDMTGVPDRLAPAVVVFAVKPQLMAAAAADAAPYLRTGFCLSIAAGKPLAYFEGLFGPDTPVIRAMPNTPAAVGRGVSVLAANAAATPADRRHAESLMQAVGTTAWLADEALMDAVTAVSGSGPAYVFHLVEALAQAGAAAGLPAPLAMRLARDTVIGAGELLHRSDEDATALRTNVTSPGGTTAAALAHLMDAETGLPPLMVRAVAAARDRGRALAD